MQKYLFRGTYTPEGYQRLMEEGGTKRVEAARRLVESVGGTVEALYFSFTEDDVYAIVNLPDDINIGQVALEINMRQQSLFKWVTLLTPEEMDEAVRRRLEYQARK